MMDGAARNPILAELAAATSEILVVAPRDVDTLKQGRYGTDAGNGGQYFSTFDAANHEARWLAEHGLPLLIWASTLPDWELSRQKRLFHLLIGHRMDFVSWIGLPEVARLVTSAAAAVDSIESSADLKTLLIALERYLHGVQSWTTFHFPWGIGAVFPHDWEGAWRAHMEAVLNDPNRGPLGPASTSADELCRRIDAATHSVATECPKDIARLVQRQSPHAAGSYGQAFSTFDYVAQEMRWISEQAFPLAIRLTLDDDCSAKDVGRILARYPGKATAFLHWMGLDDYPMLCWDVLAVAPDIEDKTELRRLIVAIERFAHAIQGWLAYHFPYGAGGLFPRFDTQDSAVVTA